MESCDAFIIVYSVTDLSTFRSIVRYRNVTEKYNDNCEQCSIPVGLVGTKSDLSHLREVPRCEAKALASIYNWSFMECSSANDDNVQDIFHSIIRNIRKSCNHTVANSPSMLSRSKDQLHKKSIFNKFGSQFSLNKLFSKAQQNFKGNFSNKASYTETDFVQTSKLTYRRRSYSLSTIV